jgi:hypothetical protein
MCVFDSTRYTDIENSAAYLEQAGALSALFRSRQASRSWRVLSVLQDNIYYEKNCLLVILQTFKLPVRPQP